MKTPPFRTLVPITPRLTGALGIGDEGGQGGGGGGGGGGGYRPFLPPDTPPPPFGDITWSCESKTGTATIFGIAGYSSDSNPYNPLQPELWEGQYRVWKRRRFAGTLLGPSTEGAEFCPPPCPDIHTWREGTFYEPNPAGGAPLSVSIRDVTVRGNLGGGACSILEQYTDEWESLPVITDAAITITSLTQRMVSGLGCVGSGSLRRYHAGAVAASLEDEQFFFNALTSEIGDSCCVSLTYSTLAIPELPVGITMTGIAVRVKINNKSYSPGTVRPVYIKLARTIDGVTTITTVSTNVVCWVDSYYYVPMTPPGTPGYCVVGVTG